MGFLKIVLRALIQEVNSKPCPYCGKWHKAELSPANELGYLKSSNDEGCDLWNKDVNDRAKKFLKAVVKPSTLR